MIFKISKSSSVLPDRIQHPHANAALALALQNQSQRNRNQGVQGCTTIYNRYICPAKQNFSASGGGHFLKHPKKMIKNFASGGVIHNVTSTEAPRAALFYNMTSTEAPRAALFDNLTSTEAPRAALFHNMTSTEVPRAALFHNITSTEAPRAALFHNMTSKFDQNFKLVWIRLGI